MLSEIPTILYSYLPAHHGRKNSTIFNLFGTTKYALECLYQLEIDSTLKDGIFMNFYLGCCCIYKCMKNSKDDL